MAFYCKSAVKSKSTGGEEGGYHVLKTQLVSTQEMRIHERNRDSSETDAGCWKKMSLRLGPGGDPGARK